MQFRGERPHLIHIVPDFYLDVIKVLSFRCLLISSYSNWHCLGRIDKNFYFYFKHRVMAFEILYHIWIQWGMHWIQAEANSSQISASSALPFRACSSNPIQLCLVNSCPTVLADLLKRYIAYFYAEESKLIWLWGEKNTLGNHGF